MENIEIGEPGPTNTHSHQLIIGEGVSECDYGVALGNRAHATEENPIDITEMVHPSSEKNMRMLIYTQLVYPGQAMRNIQLIRSHYTKKEWEPVQRWLDQYIEHLRNSLSKNDIEFCQSAPNLDPDKFVEIIAKLRNSQRESDIEFFQSHQV